MFMQKTINLKKAGILGILFFSMSPTVATADGIRENATSVQTVQQNVNIKGKVADSNGEPIIGASIRVKGLSAGVVSDLEGNFELQIPSGHRLL